ncbi:hypothetical protein KY290_015822 [Solanum tuberosum]|uniref:Uncharacterized protein n=1 Tax=Solanum tuberosum TaxID=4113 RepID=A0ABQ7VUX5_SOLTU|nr:hypothetical protein KY289_013653 [Solanum tuberosum]KAH0716974.1 hypothetical protein KY285_013005 [Solanum tuberosum]KAH0771841.1 hypothetical protein KY290_015822 [Solanum tuberosum]
MMMVWYGILHNNSFGCRFELIILYGVDIYQFDPIGSFGRPICGSRFELRTSNSRFTEFCSQQFSAVVALLCTCRAYRGPFGFLI